MDITSGVIQRNFIVSIFPSIKFLLEMCFCSFASDGEAVCSFFECLQLNCLAGHATLAWAVRYIIKHAVRLGLFSGLVFGIPVRTILADQEQAKTSRFQKISRVLTNKKRMVGKSFRQLLGYKVIDLFNDESDYLQLDKLILIRKTLAPRRDMILEVLSSYFPGDLKVLKVGKYRYNIQPFRWRVNYIWNSVWIRQMALAMVTHPRLGADSHLRILSDDILGLINLLSLG
jgi:hypothetical protein